MKPKPRLLIILNRLSIGGPAVNTLALAASLSDSFEILLVAGNPLPHEVAATHWLQHYTGFQVRIIPDFTRHVLLGKDIKAYREIKSIIRDFQPQVVHTHGSKPGILGRWAAYRMKVPLIIHTFHGHVFSNYFSPHISRFIVWLEQRMAGITHLIIAINQKIHHELINQYKIASAEKIWLAPLGLDLAYYQQYLKEHSQVSFREEFELQLNEIAVAAVGRLVPVKNHRLFLRTAIELIKKNTASCLYRFFLVGDGPERKWLIDFLEKKGIAYTLPGKKNPNASIHFLLWRTDIPVIMSGIDILLHTSLNEGTPVSIMEALAAGKPVIATPVGGIPQLLKDSEGGVAAKDEASLTEAVQSLAKNPAIRSEMGAKGAIFVKNHLSLHAQSLALKNKIEAFLKE
ncbi:MAG: glycosyltransferase [Bacteroidetes bacterium]|nr:glycosyltransferase [Bacteroidota bacterium]